MTTTERYRQIMAWAAEGVPTSEIAARLHLSERRTAQIKAGPPPGRENPPPIDLVAGSRHGDLRYIGPAENPGGKTASSRGRWGKFRCRCGREVTAKLYAVTKKRGRTVMCGKGCPDQMTPDQAREIRYAMEAVLAACDSAGDPVVVMGQVLKIAETAAKILRA